MAVNAKTIKRRIKSVTNTKKITKAMQLVDAAKMRKAVAAVLSSRPYATLAWSLVDHLTAKIAMDEPHPLLAERKEVKRTLAILYTSDRGLCGGFNAQVLRTTAEFIAKRPAGTVAFVTVGKRGEAWLNRRQLPIAASFQGLLQAPTANSLRPLAKVVMDEFVKGTCDEVAIIYNDYISAIAQKPRARTILPLSRDAELGHVDGKHAADEHVAAALEALFEPDPRAVLDAILPRILESQVYQAALESKASEHSARMVAMQSATDAASEMLEDLNFTYNQARQAGITREIAEISAGTAAIAG